MQFELFTQYEKSESQKINVIHDKDAENGRDDDFAHGREVTNKNLSSERSSPGGKINEEKM